MSCLPTQSAIGSGVFPDYVFHPKSNTLEGTSVNNRWPWSSSC